MTETNSSTNSLTERLVAVADKDIESRQIALGILDSALTQTTSNAIITTWDDMSDVRPGDLLVLCGKESVKRVIPDKSDVKITKEAGKVFKIEIDGVEFDTVLQLCPKYIERQKEARGGNAEKMLDLWADVWDQIGTIMKGVKVETPKVYAFRSAEKIIRLLEKVLSEGHQIAYDYEAHGDVSNLRPELCRDFYVDTIGIAYEEDGKIYSCSFPLDHKDAQFHLVEGSKERVEILWRQIINRENHIAHFCRYEHKCNIKRFGGSAFLRDTLFQRHALHELADAGLERIMVFCGLLWGSFKDENDEYRKNPKDAPWKPLCQYNALDAYATIQCYNYMKKLILDEDRLFKIQDMDEKFSYHLAHMEMDGLQVDPAEVAKARAANRRATQDTLKKLRSTPEIKRTEKWAKENVKSMSRKDEVVFNPKSTPMMRHFVLDELKLNIKDKTAKGGVKLSKDILSKYEDEYEVLSVLNDYRSREAMQIFLNKWDNYINPYGCVCSSYSQHIVVTGRLSSADPPLQNIPKGDPIRRVFVSRYGDEGILINADYAQQEPRLIAGWSGEQKLIDALVGGLDLHAFVAAEIYGLDIAEVSGRHRDHGKRMNLGIAYGQTEFGLANKTDMSVDEAREFINTYNKRFPGVEGWRQDFHRQAIRLGYVCDLFGARRHLPDAQSTDQWKRNRALRQAGNYPVQGTAYRFTQISFGYLRRLFIERSVESARAVGQVHDSIVIDVKKSELEETLITVRDAMLVHNGLSYWKNRGVPMAIDLKVGPNLYEAEEIDVPTESWRQNNAAR